MRSEISFSEIMATGVWSPSLFSADIACAAPSVPISEFLDEKEPFDKGFEPGADSYLAASTHAFVRTRAFMEEFLLLYPRGDSIVPLNPNAFSGSALSAGDILLVKDSNVGDVAVVPEGDWARTGYSNGVVRLRIVKDRLYLLGFLKFGNFKDQVEAVTPRGATIKHAGTKWLKARVALPVQDDSSELRCLISILVQGVIDAENELRKKAQQIGKVIDNEIRSGQRLQTFNYVEPTYHEIIESGRFDAAFHGQLCKQDIFLVHNYERGYHSPEEAGFNIIPCPSLEIKLIKKRVDSLTAMDGFYKIFLPKNISEYGTMISTPYLGTPATLPTLRQGDVLIGEAGFRKGRSFVMLEKEAKATTNAHGLIARHHDGDIKQAIFFRCIFDWYRSRGLIDALAAGGSGGHFSPSYFHLLSVPKSPAAIKESVVKLYNTEFIEREHSLDTNFLTSRIASAHSEVGVFQLGKLIAARKLQLRRIYMAISSGQTVDVGAELQRAC